MQCFGEELFNLLPVGYFPESLKCPAGAAFEDLLLPRERRIFVASKGNSEDNSRSSSDMFPEVQLLRPNGIFRQWQ
jgi:hypothetical protein